MGLRNDIHDDVHCHGNCGSDFPYYDGLRCDLAKEKDPAQ